MPKKPAASPALTNALHDHAPGAGMTPPKEHLGNAGETHQEVGSDGDHADAPTGVHLLVRGDPHRQMQPPQRAPELRRRLRPHQPHFTSRHRRRATGTQREQQVLPIFPPPAPDQQVNHRQCQAHRRFHRPNDRGPAHRGTGGLRIIGMPPSSSQAGRWQAGCRGGGPDSGRNGNLTRSPSEPAKCPGWSTLVRRDPGQISVTPIRVFPGSVLLLLLVPGL